VSYVLPELCLQKINELSQYQMIWTDTDGFVLKPEGIEIYDFISSVSNYNALSFFCVEPGRLMTKYYLKFETMKYIINTPTSYSLDEALHIVCHAEEISCMSNLLWYITRCYLTDILIYVYLEK